MVMRKANDYMINRDKMEQENSDQKELIHQLRFIADVDLVNQINDKLTSHK